MNDNLSSSTVGKDDSRKGITPEPVDPQAGVSGDLPILEPSEQLQRDSRVDSEDDAAHDALVASDKGGQGRRIFGVPRLIAFAAIGLVCAIIIAVAAMLIVNGVKAATEARETATSDYDGAFTSYRDASAEFNARLKDAKSLLLATNEDQVSDADQITQLTSAVEEAETYSKYLGVKQAEVEQQSNEQLIESSEDLKKADSELRNAATALQGATDSLESDVEAKRIADEEARKAAELAASKAAAQPVSYGDLFRAGDSVQGTYFRFEGKVIQDAGSGSYRVSITQSPGYSRVFWEDPILVQIAGEPSQRILEDDIISFVAVSMGVQSYESIFGQTIELPMVLAAASDVAITGHDG